MSTEQQTTTCRDRYGFWLGDGPDGGLWLFVPAGHDPKDGAEQTLARMASPVESQLWKDGKLDQLASVVSPHLPRQHAPSPVAKPKPRSRWGRLLDALWVGKHRNN